MTPMREKTSLEGGVGHFDDAHDLKALEDADFLDVSEEEAKRIMWKIDRRLITVTGLCYCISLLDRGNLGVAAVAG